MKKISRRNKDQILKQSWENIKGSADWYSAIFDGSRDAIFLTNVYGFIADVNIAAEILTGYPKEDLLKMSVPDLHDRVDLDAYYDFFDRILADENIMSESIIRRKDGTHTPIEFRNRRITISGIHFMLTIARDISAQKQAGAKLLESEERYRNLVELSPTGIAVYQDGIFVYVNKAGLKIIGGKDQKEILGKPVISIVRPESREEVIKRMEFVASGIPAPPLEERLTRLDGSFFDAEVISIPTTYNDKPAAQVIVIDITARKKAENELKEKEEKYRTIFDSTGTITLIVEENAEIVMANRECFELSGYSPEELVGQKWTRFVSPESLEKMLKNHKLRREGPNLAPKKYQANLIHRNCEIRNVILDIAMIPGSKQSVVSMLDITDQKTALTKLLESDSKYRLLSEQSGIGVGLFSPEGKILFFNEKALKNLGGISTEYIGKTLAEVFGELNGKEFSARIIKVIKTGKYYDYEDCIETPKGKYWFLSNHTRICDSDGRVIGVQVVSHDITELKRIEVALKQASDYNRSLIEASLDPLVTIGSDGKILDVNKATQEITGYSRQKLIGTDFSSYFTDPAKAQSGYEEVFLKGFVRDYSLEIKNIKGEVIPVLYNATLYRDEEGKVIGVFAAARDISELKKVEDVLKKKEANLRSLIENSDWSIWSITRSFELIDANSTFIENFKICTGRTIDVGDDVIDGLPAALKKDWIRYYKRCLNGEHFNVLKNTIPPLNTSSMRYSFNPITTKDGEVIGLTIIGQNISDLKKTEEKLKQSATELRELSRHIEELMETERNQIAHDLHDDLGQKLTALNMDIAWLKSRMGVQSRTVENKMLGMSQLLNDSFESLRKISYGLRPGILDNLGLYPAIEWQLSEFKKTTGINYNLSFVPKEKSIDNKVSLVVFRIIQESLTNVARHSHATKVTVKIKLDNEKLKLLVIDNGIGFDSELLKNRQSFGLLGMKERARTYGGEVTIRGNGGEGTSVALDIPIKAIQ